MSGVPKAAQMRVEVYQRPDGTWFCRTSAVGPAATPADGLLGVILVPADTRIEEDGRGLRLAVPGRWGPHPEYPNRAAMTFGDGTPGTRVKIRADQLSTAARQGNFGAVLVEAPDG
jgi:hypothetical protein